jgi:hypothetical protein
MKQLLTTIFTACAMLLMASVVQAGHMEHKGEVNPCHHRDAAAKSCSHASHLAGPFFLSPKDGSIISGKVHIEMGIYDMKVHKAGELIDGTGHHHLIIDGAYIPETSVVPKDARRLHFGKGKSAADIDLAPGKHTLTLQFADGHHMSYGKVFSRTIHITVK